MFGDSFGSDMSVVVGNERISVHKFILGARSSVFKTMLTCGFSESTSNEILISDFEPTVVRGFVEYLYTDNVSEFVMNLHSESLLQIAHKYNVQGLLILCEVHLSNHLTAQNIVSRLTLADTFNCVFLKDVCMKFVSENVREVFSIHSTTDVCKLMSNGL
jgi:hypothetical protein